MKDSYAELFELFWENSKFSEATIGEFQKRIEEYSGLDHEPPGLQFPAADFMLPMPNDELMKQMRRRASSRKFSDRPLTKNQLGSLLAAVGTNSFGGRTFPSGGATYCVEVFVLLDNYDGELNRQACYYNFDNHSLTPVGPIPGWEDYAEMINIDLSGTTPSALFVFAVFPERATIKYGERGGRFALIEAGQAAQNLALRLVQEKMAGVEVGGLLDNRVRELIGLQDTSAGIALGFAVGHPART
jgi:SagB-type dehydrogenase family enzyme